MGSQRENSQVVWFEVPCRDIDRAIGFYGAVLGCKIEKDSPAPGFEMGVLPHEGASVGGCLFSSPDAEPSDKGVLVYLNCHGRLDEAIAQVEPNGGLILMHKHQIGPHGFRAIIRDSEGNRVALHSM